MAGLWLMTVLMMVWSGVEFHLECHLGGKVVIG